MVGIEDSGALAFLTRIPAHCNLVLHGNPISEDAWQTLETGLVDRFAFEYADDLLSIPRRAGNRPPVPARTDREAVLNTLVPPTPDIQEAATDATEADSGVKFTGHKHGRGIEEKPHKSSDWND